MAVRIHIPTPLRTYAGGNATVEASGLRVAELLEDLVEQFPDLRRHLFTDDGRLRNFVNVYKNDEDIRHLNDTSTEVAEGEELTIVPSIAGGVERDGKPAAGANGGRSFPRWAVQRDVSSVKLANEEIARYSRHLIMPEVTMEGQKRLKAGSVLLVGAGGLGSPLALYLAAAGVGRIGIVDFDVVDASNLQRQVIHGTGDLGKPKLQSARETLHDINPHVEVVLHEARLSSENALEIFRDYDIIADGTDNFPTRYLVNDACVLLGKPNVYGSIFRFEGQASVFHAAAGPCYRCLYPEPPPPGLVPSCAEGGVLGILPGVIGLLQATEAVKLLIGEGEPLIGRLLLYDALRMSFRELRLRRNPECPMCGENPTIRELIDYEAFCGVPGAQSAGVVNEEVSRMVADMLRQTGGSAQASGQSATAVQPSLAGMTPEELKAKQEAGAPVVLVDVREPHEAQICSIPGSELMPLATVPERMEELDRSREIVFYCKYGQRSAQAALFCAHHGFERVYNLAGGILAWADDIDPEMPKY
ncbi:MAG: molybdopterin-synthase adenylyltransferase MoeB [Candidatus Eisenbacteria bacterium]|nr:molybdopterin-synthase adenylyltransferase MoeB [Candidatus Eisenbacteria bacterium]